MQDNGQLIRDSAERPRLRSSEPDLKVIVGSDETGGTQEYWHYRAILAFESGYVDTLLSTQIGEQNGTITFPDVTPSQWKQLMGFLRDPYGLWTAKSSDLMEYTRFFIKYHFSAGIRSCDDALSNRLPRPRSFLNVEKKLGEWIDIILLGHELNLKCTFLRGKKLIMDIFCNALNPRDDKTGTDLFLKSSVINELLPVIATFQDTIYGLIHIDVTNPVFPTFVRHEAAAVARRAQMKYNRVHVSYPWVTPAGPYTGELSMFSHTESADGVVRYRQEFALPPCFELVRCPNRGIWQFYYGNRLLSENISEGNRFLNVPPAGAVGWVNVVSDVDPRIFPLISHCTS